MVNQRGHDLPARLPLRIMVTGQLPHPDGGSTYQERWRVLHPGQRGYDAAYFKAMAAWRSSGQPMPYAIPDRTAE